MEVIVFSKIYSVDVLLLYEYHRGPSSSLTQTSAFVVMILLL